jgi:aspartyl-tRNA(Asn)/glutamyl-tRNA(Gln) amidotransferase subunit B
MSVYDKYEAVIGLEVHIQLSTKSKAYSPDSAEYGAPPNTNVSVITLGHPGTLPVTNEKVIEYAIRLGLACNSIIRKENHYSRKNYFYADLPKGYQITQDTTPVCSDGYITIKTKSGEEKKINLIRIHMEEDAGKSIHDQDPFDTLIDLNRAGVALLEMVSHPEIRSGEEAYQYLTEVRRLVRYLGICDGNMEEGSLRCDANVSVRLKGSELFGKRVEVKNMNSIRNVQRAIEFEIKRQIDDTEAGKAITQDTRSFDAVGGTTFVMRSKEMANDYRYFPDPDLPPVIISEAVIELIRAQMPALPQELYKKYVHTLGLSEYDAGILTDSQEIALYFEELIKICPNYKAAANWVMGPVKSYLNENAVDIKDFPVDFAKIAELIKLIDDGKISYSVAAQKVFPQMILSPDKTPIAIAEQLNLIQESDSGLLKTYAEQVVAAYPEKVAEYKAGKVGLLGLFMGEVMKLSKGKADPKLTSQLIKDILDRNS